MPLEKGKSQETISKNIAELHQGKTYAHTAAKFGEKRAHAQSIAIAMREAGKSRPKHPRKDGESYADWLARNAAETRKGRS
jgi:hypothetical protein